MRKKVASPKPYSIADGITQSMLRSFLSCRQRSAFELAGWEPILRETVYDYGTFFHRLCEIYYGKDLGARDCFLSIENNPLGAGQEYETMLGYAEPVWEAYCKHWRSWDKKYKAVATEKTFDFVWKGYHLRGKLDGVWKLRANGKLWLLETKTKSQVNEESISDCLTFDFQIQFYALAIAHLFPKETFAGTVYNIVRKPQLKQGKDGLEAFSTRVELDIIERPDFYFKRFEVVYDAAQRERFELELKQILEDFEASCVGGFSTYRNPFSCISRQGTCPYLKACSSAKGVGCGLYARTKTLFRELT